MGNYEINDENDIGVWHLLKAFERLRSHFPYFSFHREKKSRAQLQSKGIALGETLFPLFRYLQLQFQARRFTYKLLGLMTRLALLIPLSPRMRARARPIKIDVNRRKGFISKQHHAKQLSSINFIRCNLALFKHLIQVTDSARKRFVCEAG